MLVSLDGQETFVAFLSRLGLREVLRPQGDGLHHVDWHQDPLCRQQLGTFLQDGQRGRKISLWVLSVIVDRGCGKNAKRRRR